MVARIRKTWEQWRTQDIIFRGINVTQFYFQPVTVSQTMKTVRTRMWANAQPDGRPAEHRWRPLFNAAKFGSRPLLDTVQ